MALTNNTIATTFKDILTIENSNAGFDNNTDQIKSGNGNGSAMYAGARQFKVQPSADNTQIFRVNDKDGYTGVIL